MSKCEYVRPACNCGTRSAAVCVDYQGLIPDFSSLKDDKCVNAQEVIEDIYDLIGKLRDLTDTTTLEGCISKDNTGIKDLLTKIETKVCVLETTQQGYEKFSDCSLNYSGLVDVCDNLPNIKSQCEFNQFVIDQIVKIKNGG